MNHIPYVKIRADEDPQIIFKKCADAMAEYEEAKNRAEIKLPEYKKVEIIKNRPGWINFFRQLRP